MDIITTERLSLRKLSTDDAEFILELVCDSSFIRYIGDKGVKNIEDARQYILGGPVKSYVENGFGLMAVRELETQTPVGICGLLRRPGLCDADIGFAFLPRYHRMGYATESAMAVLSYGRADLGLQRIVAITAEENEASIKLLEKIGMKFEKTMTLPGEQTPVCLYA